VPRFPVQNLRIALLPLASSSLPINRQRELEKSSLDAARAQLEHSAKQFEALGLRSSSHLQREQLQSWMHEWLGLLETKLEKDLAEMKERVGSPAAKRQGPLGGHSSNKQLTMKESNLMLFLTVLPLNKIALITVIESMRNVGGSGVYDGFKALRGLVHIGKAVETEYRADMIKNVEGVDSASWLRLIDPNTQKPSRVLVGSLWRKIGKKLETSEVLEADWRSVWTPSWSNAVHADLGGYLMAALMDVAKVECSATDGRGRKV